MWSLIKVLISKLGELGNFVHKHSVLIQRLNLGKHLIAELEIRAVCIVEDSNFVLTGDIAVR